MIVITGIIKLESENELARVKEALIRRAIRSRADAGNIDYVFAQSLEDPTEIRLTEK
jgi:quinol monooxygenase YgiN